MALVLSVLIALLGMAPSLYASQVMGRFVTHGRITTLVAVSIGLGIAIMGEVTFRLVRHRLLEVVCINADEELASMVLQKAGEGERLRVLSALEVVMSTYSGSRAALLMDLPTGILYIAALWFISPAIGLAATVGVILAMLLDLGIGRVMAVFSAQREATRGRIAAPVEHPGALADYIDSGARLGRIGAVRDGMMVAANNVTYCLVIAVGAVLVVNADLPAGTLFGAGLLSSRAASIALRVGGLLAELKRGQPAMEAVVRILREPRPVTTVPNPPVPFSIKA